MLTCLKNRVDEQDIDDCAQEVWLRVWRNWDRHVDGPITAWLATITRNYLIDRSRRLGNQAHTRYETTRLTPDDDLAEPEPEPEDHSWDQLRDRLGVLTPGQRRILLRTAELGSLQDAAADLNIPYQGAKKARQRAIAHLQKELKVT